jgi:hypothetical protein
VVGAMTTTAAKTCPFGWCIYDHPNHTEHTWTDGVPAKVEGKPGRVYAYAVLDDTNHANDEILIGTQQNDDEMSGSEGWLTIKDAEYLRDTLTQAITYAKREQQK